MNVVVTDGNNRISLAVVRSLGRRGIRVVSVEQERFSRLSVLCFSSRYCKESHILPDIDSVNSEYIVKLQEIASHNDVLIPVSCDTIHAVSRHLEEFKACTRVIAPTYQSLAAANDKAEVIKIADRLKVPVPKTYFLENTSEVNAAAREIKYPVVIKVRNDEGIVLKPYQKYHIIKSPDELIHSYFLFGLIQPKPVIQEYIEGQGYGFEALFDERGSLVAYFCHRRLREYPVSGGPSSFCESVEEPRLVEYGLRLLLELKWQGVAMVEFKKDIKDGEFKLIEINPKFWGTLPLAIISGIDFPYLLYNASLGKGIGKNLQYRTGVRMRFLFLDIPAVIQALRRGRKRFTVVWDFIRGFFDIRIKEGLFSFSDICPGVIYLKQRLEDRFKSHKRE